MSETLLCTLRRKSDGKVVEYRDEWTLDNLDGVVYQWTDGNYGCDCNRTLFFARASGEDEPDMDSLECGDDERFELLKIVTANGLVLYPEDADGRV